MPQKIKQQNHLSYLELFPEIIFKKSLHYTIWKICLCFLLDQSKIFHLWSESQYKQFGQIFLKSIKHYLFLYFLTSISVLLHRNIFLRISLTSFLWPAISIANLNSTMPLFYPRCLFLINYQETWTREERRYI